MTTRKVYALCKKLGLGTTYYDMWGWEHKGDIDELEARVNTTLLEKLLVWYETELAKRAKSGGMRLKPALGGEGLDLIDGTDWHDCTVMINVNPVDAIGKLCREMSKGPKMPDFDQFRKRCKILARTDWNNRASFPTWHAHIKESAHAPAANV